MEAYLLDWANLLLRWVHVITAIAWIGSSFYFVFLDSNLVPPQRQDLKAKGVDGEMWAVHGGGFYNPQKYQTAPPQPPDSKLHWFYWESYSTWLSGMALFTVLYLWNASTYLIDKSLMAWSPGAAIGVALSFLVVFWLVYDLICRAFGFRKHGELIVAALLLIVAGLPMVCGAGGVFDCGRDDSHRHERQRVFLDHPRPEKSGGRHAGRTRGRCAV
jgi:uncharacterized membrane protein